MENRFFIQGDYAFIEVPYKKTVVTVKIDKEDLEKVSSISGRWILIRKNQRKDLFYFVCNKDKSIYLHKLIMNASSQDKVYVKDHDYTHLSKSNLTVNTYVTNEEFRLKRKKAYHNMSQEARQHLLEGIRLHRYSKNWSDKLAVSKKGVQNPKVRLNPKTVRKIREQYALRRFTQQDLADSYQVARTTIADIVNYRTWNEIGEDPLKEYRVYQENRVFKLNLKETPIQEYEFTNRDIPMDDFVIQIEGSGLTEYMFCQKIGSIKLYVEIRNHRKEFVHSFEVVFPEFLTPLHIHNYVITQRKPVRYMNRHDIHSYMTIISTFLFGESYPFHPTTTASF